MMTTIIRRVIPLAVAACALLGCKFETTLDGIDGFSCSSDDDCVSGYLCSTIGAPEAGSGEGSGEKAHRWCQMHPSSL